MQDISGNVPVSVRFVCCVLGFLCFALHTRAEVSGAEILYDNLDDQEQVVVNCPTGFSGSLDLTCQKGVILTEGHLGMRLDQLSWILQERVEICWCWSIRDGQLFRRPVGPDLNLRHLSKRLWSNHCQYIWFTNTFAWWFGAWDAMEAAVSWRSAIICFRIFFWGFTDFKLILRTTPLCCAFAKLQVIPANCFSDAWMATWPVLVAPVNFGWTSCARYHWPGTTPIQRPRVRAPRGRPGGRRHGAGVAAVLRGRGPVGTGPSNGRPWRRRWAAAVGDFREGREGRESREGGPHHPPGAAQVGHTFWAFSISFHLSSLKCVQSQRGWFWTCGRFAYGTPTLLGNKGRHSHFSRS